MKHLTYLAIVSIALSSCVSQKQSSNAVGRTDDVYFTANDTRKKEVVQTQQFRSYSDGSLQDGIQKESNAGNYTSSYANRLRHFGSCNSYFYDAYRPTIVPSLYFNNYSGWSMGMSFVDPRFGYRSGFNSPFSPYYGFNMPYYDPFYAYGWNNWMNRYPGNFYYYNNPYFYNPCSYGYGYGYGYNNPYYNNFYYYNKNNNTSGSSSTSARRTGTSNNVPSSTTTTTQPQNSTQNNSNSNSGTGRWYNNGNSDRSGSGSSGTSGSSGKSGSSGNSDRGTSGSGGSQRRR